MVWWLAGLTVLCVVLLIRLSLANDRIDNCERETADNTREVADRVRCESFYSNSASLVDSWRREIDELADALGYELNSERPTRWRKKGAKRNG